MPTFIRPSRVIVETGGGAPGAGVLLMVAAVAMVVAVVTAVVAFLFAHIWIIAAAVVVEAAVPCWLLVRWRRRYGRLPAGVMLWDRRPAAARAISVAPRALPPVRRHPAPVVQVRPVAWHVDVPVEPGPAALPEHQPPPRPRPGD